MYEVEIKKSAIKQLSKLPTKEALWLSNELSKLSNNPRPEGCKKLKGNKNQYRIRVGNYRAVYNIDDQILIVEVTKIGDRKDIY